MFEISWILVIVLAIEKSPAIIHDIANVAPDPVRRQLTVLAKLLRARSLIYFNPIDFLIAVPDILVIDSSNFSSSIVYPTPRPYPI